MRQQDEINNLIGRDKENMEKQNLLHDEIQQVILISFLNLINF